MFLQISHQNTIDTCSTPAVIDRPTQFRFLVLGFLCTVTMLLYLDRMCIGKAAPFIQDELRLTDRQMGFVHAAFMVAYGLFEVISGHWADRYGARRVLTRIVVWWSVFTALTGWASSFWMLLAVRFLFGAGEAGALPNVTRIIDQWFPIDERGKIRGIVNLPALLGGMIAPIATAFLMEWLGWRWAVHLYGALGLIWATAFYREFRDHPADHPAVNSAELTRIGTPLHDNHSVALPWRAILANRNVWAMSGVMICGASTMSVIFSWYPTYIERLYGVSNIESGWWNSGIMFAGACGCVIGGWSTDIANRRIHSLRWKQSLIGTCAFAIACLAMFAASGVDDYRLKSVLLAMVCLGVHAHAAAWWTANSNISGRHVSAIFGLMNSMGVLGGAACQIAFGYLPRIQWPQAFFVSAIILAVGTVCWAFVDPRQTIATTPVIDGESKTDEK